MNEQKTITQSIDADVVVCGAGCAGFSAALTSARQGCHTVLLEKSQMIGGTATSGLVGPFMTSYDGTGRRQIVKGLFDEVVTRLKNRNGAIHPESAMVHPMPAITRAWARGITRSHPSGPI